MWWRWPFPVTCWYYRHVTVWATSGPWGSQILADCPENFPRQESPTVTFRRHWRSSQTSSWARKSTNCIVALLIQTNQEGMLWEASAFGSDELRSVFSLQPSTSDTNMATRVVELPLRKWNDLGIISIFLEFWNGVWMNGGDVSFSIANKQRGTLRSV